MAKVQYSAVVGDARGKIGGVVATKGRFGAVVRTKVSPVQPRSTAQRNVRAGFTNESKGWSGELDDLKRAAWDSFARANPVKDVFGNTRILTGHQMYVRLNRVIVQCGGTQILLPPLALSVTEPGTLSITAVAGTPGIVTATASNAPGADECAEFWAAAPKSPGRRFLGSAYRLIAVAPAGMPSPWADSGLTEKRFGSIQADQVYHVMIKFGNKVTGAQGLGVEASCVAT